MAANQKNDKENKKNVRALNERYTKRITICKQGQMASAKGDVKNMIKYYNQYIKILADVKDIDDPSLLTPNHFDKEKELSEMLLISHVYWDLCKLYDLTPHLEGEFRKCLNKFVQFTLGTKYQVVNAEMLRKFIRKGHCKHKEDFEVAYRSIYMGTKKCFVASFAYDENHHIVEVLRNFRDRRQYSPYWRKLFNIYYLYSPSLVSYLKKAPQPIKITLKNLLKLPIFCLASTLILIRKITKKS